MATLIRIDDCYRCSICEALPGNCNCPNEEWLDAQYQQEKQWTPLKKPEESRERLKPECE